VKKYSGTLLFRKYRPRPLKESPLKEVNAVAEEIGNLGIPRLRLSQLRHCQAFELLEDTILHDEKEQMFFALTPKTQSPFILIIDCKVPKESELHTRKIGFFIVEFEPEKGKERVLRDFRWICYSNEGKTKWGGFIPE